MHNASPRQLFVSGCLRLCHSGLAALDFLDGTDSMYGVDESDMGASEDNSLTSDQPTSVEVPQSRIRLSSEQLELLRTQVDPLSPSNNYAIQKYERALTLIQGWLCYYDNVIFVCMHAYECHSVYVQVSTLIS